MSLGTLIRERREQLNMTQDQVAAFVEISKPYLSNIETCKAKPPTDRVLRALERVLKFEKNELLKMAHLVRTPMDVREGYENLEAEAQKLRVVVKKLMELTGKKRAGGVDLDEVAKKVGGTSNVTTASAGVVIPVINKVNAGYPAHFTDLDYPIGVADEYTRCPDMHDPQAFAARVWGDSMEPEYHQGDIVVFSPNTPPRNADDCFVRFVADGGTTFKRFYQDSDTTIRLQPLNNRYPAETYPKEQVTGLWPAVYRIQSLRR